MKLARREFLHLAAGAAAMPAVLRVAKAQTYPTRPITVIVPYAAGGATDVLGRVLAERMRGSLGHAIIIENVSGADGSIGAGRAARAKLDGYTIGLGSVSTHVLNGALYSLQYDVLDVFAPILLLGASPYVLYTRKTMPANDLRELITWLKANPNKASAGFGLGGLHLVTAFFRQQTRAQFTLVPYRAGVTLMQDLVAGQIDLAFNTSDQLPLMRAGSVKAYAVTSEMRLVLAPEIPAFAEIGLPALSFSAWVALFAPKGTPKDIIGTLNAAAEEALADPAVRSRLTDLGFEIFSREQQTPEALAAMQRADAAKWWPIIKELGIKAE